MERRTPEKVLLVRCQAERASPWTRPIILDKPGFMFSVGCANIVCCLCNIVFLLSLKLIMDEFVNLMFFVNKVLATKQVPYL